jgi:hypothetical protein
VFAGENSRIGKSQGITEVGDVWPRHGDDGDKRV